MGENMNQVLSILDKVPAYVLVCDQDENVLFANDAYNRYFKAPSDILSLGTSDKFQHETLGKWFSHAVSPVEWFEGKKAFLHTGAEMSAQSLPDYATKETSAIDKMTGIFKISTALHYLQGCLEMLKEDEVITIAYVNVNNVKTVNDTFGQQEGDELIMTVVSCVKGVIRKSDVFARIQGDKFLIIFPYCAKAVVDDIMVIIKNKLNLLTESSEKQYKISVSCGIYEISAIDIVLSMDEIIEAAKNAVEV